MTRLLLKPRDRRALLVGLAIVLPVFLFRVAVVPYSRALSNARDQLELERDVQARELAALRESDSYPQLTAEARDALHAAAERLFTGADRLSAAAALVNYVGQEARRHRVLVQRSETQNADAVADGIVTLQIGVRGMADLEGLLSFLHALEGGAKLARVERLDVQLAQQFNVASGSDEEVLIFSAVVRAYALGEIDDLAALGPELAAGGMIP